VTGQNVSGHRIAKVISLDPRHLITESLTKRLDEIVPQRNNAATADIN
jgi:hypothetical protein